MEGNPLSETALSNTTAAVPSPLDRLRHPWRSLPARISTFVLAATLITSLAGTGVAVYSIDTFLREKIDQKFPALLSRVNQKLEVWYDQRGLEIGVFASSAIVVDNLSRGSRSRRGSTAEIEQYLTYLLESFPQYDGLLVLDADGEAVTHAGTPVELSPQLRTRLANTGAPSLSDTLVLAGRRSQLASAAVLDKHGRRVGGVHALMRLDALSSVLESPDVGPSGAIFVVNGEGDVIAGFGARGQSYERELPADGDASIPAEYSNGVGESVLGSARRFGRFGWSIVVEEPYDEAFAPVVSAIRRVVGINAVILLLLGAAAFRIAVSIARPIDKLSEAARRISQGEKDVVIEETSSHDEVGLLTRTFNEMSRELTANAREIEQSHAEAAEANEQLRDRNEELQSVNEVLEQLSITDGLTKLHNHRFFQDQLVRETKRAKRSKSPLSLILLDIDHFKRWNDRLGHASGDAILRRIAEVLSELIRESDLLARYGGEEFALLASNTDLEGAMRLAEKARECIASTDFVLDGPGERDPVTVSVGVADYRGDREALFAAADRALYRAKDSGRDCVMAAEDEEYGTG